MNFSRLCFLCVMSSLGIIGWHYAWPIYRDAVSVLSDWPFLLVNTIAVIAISSSAWFIYTLLNVVSDEINSRRIGDIEIDGELTEDFKLSNKYFSD